MSVPYGSPPDLSIWLHHCCISSVPWSWDVTLFFWNYARCKGICALAGVPAAVATRGLSLFAPVQVTKGVPSSVVSWRVIKTLTDKEGGMCSPAFRY